MRALIVCAFGFTVACETAPEMQSYYWLTGSTPAQREADFTYCEVVALRAAPRSVEILPAPYYEPIDFNDDLRERVQDQCMASKGYSDTYFPVCTRDQTSRAVRPSTSPAPFEVLCVPDSGGVVLR